MNLKSLVFTASLVVGLSITSFAQTINKDTALGRIMSVGKSDMPVKCNLTDDCEVAWDIAFEAAWNECMGSTGDQSYCNWYGWSQANQHALEIGCPPHSSYKMLSRWLKPIF